MKKLKAWTTALLGGCALILTACGSSVKLDETPADSRATTPAAGAPGSGSATPVKSVDVSQGPGSTGGPQGAGVSVFFDYDSFSIKDQYQSTVEAHARFLKANPGKRVSIEGHADDRGSREYNLALGQKRSDSVRRALNLLGVSDGQAEAVSFGEEKPKAQGDNEAAWAENRRADFTYKN
jgi:peptidoglycan-associated lipoprotein